MSIAVTEPPTESPTEQPAPPRSQTPARPRRTLNRLALALVGVIAAAVGQYFFSQESLWDGLLLYGVGVILFVRALGSHWSLVTGQSSVVSGQSSVTNDQSSVVSDRLSDSDEEATNHPPTPPPNPKSQIPTYQLPITNHHPPLTNYQLLITTLHTDWRRNVGVWLMLTAVGASYITYTLFGSEVGQPQAWWLYFGSLGMFIGGLLLLTKSRPWRAEIERLFPGPYTGLALLLIVMIALFMRLYQFNSLPFGIWYDEAEAGLQARRILAESSYRPIFYPPINITGHLLVLYAAALQWVGDSIQSMRLVSVMFGVGGVIAAYLFGRELRGPRFGLLLAFLVAVARWHVNFSRIAMTGVDTPFFEFLSLFFLVRWLRWGRLRDGLGVGLSLSTGLLFYTAFRLYILAILLLVVMAALIWWRWPASILRGKNWQAATGHLALVISVGWLVLLPLVQFALNNPSEFWYRTQQISIFTKRDQADVLAALQETTTKHLLMFNFEGDKNGRHNLPGMPMLDPAMAVFWMLGLGLAIRQLWSAKYRLRAAHLFFILLLFTALIGGIFSVDFEAPQSLRSIAVIPAVLYFCALAVAALGREAERSLRPLPQAWVLVPAITLAGFVLFSNAATYFLRQANDFASWNAFSTPETIVGREMAELGPAYDYVLSPFFTNHPTIRFLAPAAVKNQEPLILPGALPVRQPAERPVALFIHPDDVAVFEEAGRLYPNATFEIANSQSEDERPVVYFVNLQPSDIAAVQGLQLTYTSAPTATSSAGSPEAGATPPLRTSRAMHISATWPQDSPAADEFVAEWEGILYAPRYGAYNLRLVTPGPAQLDIDGFTIFEGPGEQFTTMTLAQGDHSIRLRAEAGAGNVALYWQPPGQAETLVPSWSLYAPPITNNGLQGTFYANAAWQGEPVLQRIDPYLDTYFHLLPLQRPYTVEWTGWLDAPLSGSYRLGLRAVQAAELYLDGQQLVTTQTPNDYIDAAVTLEAGLHEIEVRYKDNVDRSRIHLYWTRPDGTFEAIPSQNLWPPLGSPPESRAVEQTPTFEAQPLELQWVASLGGFGDQPGQFAEPRDVAVLSNGHLVIADTANRRVQLFDKEGDFITTLDGDELPFEEPVAVAVNSRDQILVLDATLQWVYRYDSRGNFIDRFAGPEARLFFPRGLTVFEDDTVAVADTGGARIAFFNLDGSFRGQIGQMGDGPGQFIEPTDILRDEQGTYFVVEAETDRIQRVDAGGNSLQQWAIPPTYSINGPHLAAGPDGSLLMTEIQSQSLIRYAPDGTLLHQWQQIGPVTLAGPVGIYFDETNSRLYVTDVQSHQVHIFEVVAG